MATIFLIISLFCFGKASDIIFVDPLNLKGVTLADATAIISDDAKITLTSDEGSKDKVLDLYFPAGITLKTVLDAIATTNNLKLSVIGSENYMFTSKSTSLPTSLSGTVSLEKYGTGINGVKIVILDSGIPPVYSTVNGKYIIKNIVPGTYIVRYEKDGYRTEGDFVTIPDKRQAILDMTLTRNGDPLKDERNIISSTNKSIGMLQQDAGNLLTEKISVTNVSPDEVKIALEKIYGDEIIVSSFPKLNMLVMKANPNVVKLARSIAKEMDKELKQVRVVAQAIEINDNLFEDIGFKWAFAKGSLKNPPVVPDTSADGSTTKKTVDSSGDNIGGLNKYIPNVGYSSSINVIRFFNNKDSFLSFSLNALQATNDAVISAIPSILIINGEKGRFDTTEEQLVSYNSVVNPTGGTTGNITTTQAVTGTAGMILEVTPIIKDNNTILLYIDMNGSTFEGDPSTITSSGGYNPKVTRRITSTVLINDGDTIFIGGMKMSKTTKGVSKVPYLSDIPYLGKLFTSKSNNESVRDIYMKLKVDIVNRDMVKQEADYGEFMKADAYEGEEGKKKSRSQFSKE